MSSEPSLIIESSAVKDQIEQSEQLKQDSQPTDKQQPVVSTTPTLLAQPITLVQTPTSPLIDFFDDAWYTNIARAFRSSISRKTVVAFGIKNAKVFSGADAVTHILQIIQSFDNTTNGNSGSVRTTVWDRQAAMDIVYTLVNTYWLFVPCGIQQRKGWTLHREPHENVQLIKADEVEKTNELWRTFIEVNDDDQSLYRLTKDALVMEDISTECFDDIVRWFADKDYGVERVDGERVGLVRKYFKEDGVFTQQVFYKWLETHLGANALQEKESIKKLFLNRHVIDKIPFSSCFKLIN